MAHHRLAENTMSLLRIRASLADSPLICTWALTEDGREPVDGESAFAQLPRGAGRVQLVLPAAAVLISRVHLPKAARRHAGSVLAYAVEETIVGEPDSSQVSWLGRSQNANGMDGADVLAVIDKAWLARWLDAFVIAGFGTPEVVCETLLLPWTIGEWRLAWDGCEGFVRTGLLEGGATDRGDRDVPPLSLRLMLDEARARGEAPVSIALYAGAGVSAPDPDAWQRALGTPLRLAGPWDWRTAPPQAGVRLAQPQRRWRISPDILSRLRPAAWIVGAALAVHATALVTDWSSLAGSQRTLRDSMTAQFRATFPDTVAVVDPVLQMRRKLAEARHGAGEIDRGDFLPMFELVTAAARDLPAGTLRSVSYEGARMSLVLFSADEAGLNRLAGRLRESGLHVERSANTNTTGTPAAGASQSTSAGATVILTVRAA